MHLAARCAVRRRRAAAAGSTTRWRRPARVERGLHPHSGDARRRRAHLRPRRDARAVGRHHRQAARRRRRRACSTDGITISLVAILRNHPGSVNPMIKSNNLLNNALAMQEAHRRGGEEALMRNYRGELAECSQSNLFVVRDGVALTPPLEAGLLEGSRGRSCSRSAGSSASRSRKRRCCPSRSASAPTKRSSPARRASSCPVVRVDDRVDRRRAAGPVTRSCWRISSEERGS